MLWPFVLIFLYSVSALKNNIVNVLAQTNLDGYPELLLYDTVANTNKKINHIDKESLSELLESEEAQAALRKSALEYSAKHIKNNGAARRLFEDESYCGNSWLYWLPWLDCPEPEPTGKQTLALIKEKTDKCYQLDLAVV